jgi:hypothetical protein
MKMNEKPKGYVERDAEYFLRLGMGGFASFAGIITLLNAPTEWGVGFLLLLLGYWMMLRKGD